VKSPNVVIVGYGHVGHGMAKIFPWAQRHDPELDYEYDPTLGDVDLAVICVPTPRAPNGACDTSIVEDAVRDIDARLYLIKSTVKPGTCERLATTYGKRIVFSPEYMGESRYWTPPQFPQPADPVGHGFVILGGESAHCSAIADMMLPVLGPGTRFRFMESHEAELVKYFENCFFALKVTFANEMRDICRGLGANYHVVREGWLDDPRVGPMHSVAFADAPGFDGKCLPKDLSALLGVCRERQHHSALLEAVAAANRDRRKES
jgi:nucleotide sugar dehydrogenase